MCLILFYFFFNNLGQHTFFLPVDAAFEVNVQLTGYDYERHNHREKPQSGPKIDKDLVDASVVESHIVPHRLLFTSHAPTMEYPTVAWLPDRYVLRVLQCVRRAYFWKITFYEKYKDSKGKCLQTT